MLKILIIYAYQRVYNLKIIRFSKQTCLQVKFFNLKLKIENELRKTLKISFINTVQPYKITTNNIYV